MANIRKRKPNLSPADSDNVRAELSREIALLEARAGTSGEKASLEPIADSENTEHPDICIALFHYELDQLEQGTDSNALSNSSVSPEKEKTPLEEVSSLSLSRTRLDHSVVPQTAISACDDKGLRAHEHVPNLGGACTANRGEHVPKHVPPAGEACTARTPISWGELANYCLASTPKATLRNICALIIRGSTTVKVEQAVKILNTLMPYERWGPGDWHKQLLDRFKHLSNGTTATIRPYPTPLDFMIEKDVAKHVPQSAMVVKGKRQGFTTKEAAFLAQRITSAALRNNRATGDIWVVLTEGYFRKMEKDYKRHTGRTLGKARNKLAAITDLLSTYGIVAKFRRRAGSNQQVNMYTIGVNNFYRRFMR